MTGNTEMNILFVLQRYPGFGGIESVTRMLAGEFIGRFGYRVAVFPHPDKITPRSYSTATCFITKLPT